MKMTIDANIMQETFRNWNRDYFTFEACETLVDYYNLIDENIEFDPIAICCDWNEYGNTPCLTWEDFISDYDYLLEDSKEFQNASEKEKINMLIEELENRTLIYVLWDSVLVSAF